MRHFGWLGLLCAAVWLPIGCGGGDAFESTGTGGTAGSTTGGAAGSGTGGTTAGGAGGSGATGGAAGAGGSVGGAAGAGATGGAAGAGGGSGGTGGASGGNGGSGIGTYVSQAIGHDNNPGTQSSPVKTIAVGISKAQSLGSNVDVYVAEGTYQEKVVMVQGINLLGGHHCDNSSCSWARDPASYNSTIKATDAEGLLAGASITQATKLDGFKIYGANGSATGTGRVAVTLKGGTPTVSNNVIVGPDVTGTGQGARGVALQILSPSNASTGAIIDQNTITAGQADVSIALGFESGGSGKSYALVTNNFIQGGKGRIARGIGAGTSGTGTRVAKNKIYSGSSNNASGDAWAISVGGELEIDANEINVDQSKVGNCIGSGYCGGILSASSTSVITNNIVLGITAPWSVAVQLAEFEVAGGAVILNANTLHGGGVNTGTSAALVLRLGNCASCGFNGFVGKIRNNILWAGGGGTRFGVYEDAPPGKTQHPVALENNDFWLSGNTAATSALYRAYDGSAQTLHTTTNAVDGTTVQLTVGSSINVSPGTDTTWHLTSGSQCINKGTATEAPKTDIDGDPRPKNNGLVDIGADEAG